MKQTATPYTPRTILATPVATLGTANPPKPPRKNARKCPADEDYSTPHPSANAHKACAPATVPTLPEKPWILTKDAETGKATIKRRRAQAATVTPSAKQPDFHALDDATFEDKVPLPRVAIGKACLIEKAVTLLDKMRPGQSKPLPLPLKYVVQKAITNAHKTRPALFVIQCQFDSAETLRVWRVA